MAGMGTEVALDKRRSGMTGTVLRKAKVRDAQHIQRLINFYAKKEVMLFRSLNDIYEGIRDYWVGVADGKIIGCAALHVDWEDLAEIRSVVVDHEHQASGIGRQLVEKCIEDAKQLELKKVFVLTYQMEFFRKMGFVPYDKDNLPHKIWGDCLKCHKFPECDEEALIIKV
jgi:amino-acid N-acetyltransferase